MPTVGDTHATLAGRGQLIKIFWIFVLGSVFGCVYETLLCLARTGHFERRVSMLYGPFNLIYGVGAVTLFLTFSWIKKKPHFVVVFLAGAVVCSAIEYFCSCLQQRLFGAASWDYSNLPLNIDGRVCLYAFLAWGALSVVWVWIATPLLDRLFGLVPYKLAVPLTLALLAPMMVDGALTVAAMFRWTDRTSGIAAVNAFAVWLDKHYPDSFMRSVFTNLKFLS